MGKLHCINLFNTKMFVIQIKQFNVQQIGRNWFNFERNRPFVITGRLLGEHAQNTLPRGITKDTDDCENPNLPIEDGLYIIKNTIPQKRNEDYVYATLPPGFSIRQSTVPNAGLGVFAEMTIPKNTRLGPYDGLLYSTYTVQSVEDDAYIWVVLSDSIDYTVKHYVDAKPKSHSSWLRYINMANTIEKENLWHLQLNYEVYYVTQECIQPGTELLIWYGDSYGKNYGLTRTTEDYMRRWNETEWKSLIFNPQLMKPPEKVGSKCYRFYNNNRQWKPDTRQQVSYCLPGSRYDVCKYETCDVNPCTGIVDCKECKGYCFHMGHYISPATNYRLIDNVNICTCSSNATATCSMEYSTYKDMCLY